MSSVRLFINCIKQDNQTEFTSCKASLTDLLSAIHQELDSASKGFLNHADLSDFIKKLYRAQGLGDATEFEIATFLENLDSRREQRISEDQFTDYF